LNRKSARTKAQKRRRAWERGRYSELSKLEVPKGKGVTNDEQTRFIGQPKHDALTSNAERDDEKEEGKA
jgi:hypothetical protein